MTDDRSRGFRRAGWRAAGLASIGVLAASASAAAQDGQRAASISVSVTVVRSCSVSAPASAPSEIASSAELRLSCAPGRKTALPIAAIGESPTLAPVAGVRAQPGFSATRSNGLLLLNVNF